VTGGDTGGDGRSLDRERFREVVEAIGRPVVTAEQVARKLGWSQSEAATALDALVDAGHVDRADVSGDPVVFYPGELGALADPERIVLFPDRREVVVEHPAQFTRARLNQFAHLVDTNRDGAYIYEIREEDVWLAPFDSIEDLLATMHDTLGERSPTLEEFVERQWARARKFALVTRDDYTVLEAASADLMGNVARQKLDDHEADLLHGLISDTEAWVQEGKEGELKRALYDAGYPVQDQRDLETGDPLDVGLRLRLRDYQREWIDDFQERGAGVFVGPPGSGKTVAAIGAMERIGGETLVLVPSRELAAQWREELLTNASLTAEQVGEYHGGEKTLAPVTIATYQTAGMDRHRVLFEDRRWGLIVFDECLSGETVVETPDGPTTFAELDADRGFDDGWTRDVDLTVRTVDPESGEGAWTEVTGVYRTEAPVQRIETDAGHVIEATPGHTHVVVDPETGERGEQIGVDPGDHLLRSTAGGDAGEGSPGQVRGDGDTTGGGGPGTPPAGPERASTGPSGDETTPPGLAVTEVTAVETVGRETVYDFETRSHTFLADGVLTHNCHHVPAPVFRRSTDLQSKHRLGLSVDGDTVVPVRRNGELRMRRIEAFVGEHLDGSGPGRTSVDGVETLGVTRDGAVVWTPVTAAICHENDSGMVTVRATNGRRVTVTEDHSLMVFDGDSGSIESRQPSDLTGNDYLLQPSSVPADGAEDEIVSESTGDRSHPGGEEPETIVGGAEGECEWLTETDLAFLEIDEVTPAGDREYVYDVSTGTETFLGDRLFCHNSATPVRESDDEREIFTLIGPPIGTDWSKLFEAGYVTEPEVEIRFVEWPDETARNEYAAASGHERRQVAATNPAKVDAVRDLLDEHGGKALVFVEYLDHGRALADALGAPFVSGETPHAERERLFREFRSDEREVLVVSRVGDEGIDLPDAELAIVASGLGGSRRQGAQRAGRTMRPAGDARMYVLATRGTTEEDFARRQVRHLASKGVRVTERDAGGSAPDLDPAGPDGTDEEDGSIDSGDAPEDSGR